MEQQIGQLNTALTKLTQAFTTLAGKVKEQNAIIERLQKEVEELKKKTPAEASTTSRGSSRKRRPRNKGDWMKVVECLNSGTVNWREISDITGIPESTCRSYGKLSEAEGNALPDLEDEDSDFVSLGIDPSDGKEVVALKESVAAQQDTQPVAQPAAQPVAQPVAQPAGGATEESLNGAIAELLTGADDLINMEF